MGEVAAGQLAPVNTAAMLVCHPAFIEGPALLGAFANALRDLVDDVVQGGILCGHEQPR